MENKKKNIELINIQRAKNSELEKKKQAEEQILETITKEMKRRERTLKIKRQKKKLRIKMVGIVGALALTSTSYIHNQKKNEEENRDHMTIEVEMETGTENVEKEEPIKVENISYAYTKEGLKYQKESLISYLKNMYIEELEEKTGDTSLTTEDIILRTASYENYVFVNRQTGEMITHGDNPMITEQKLMNDGISYDIKNNVKVYKIYDKEGKVIDCITMKEGNPIKVIVGEQYGEDSQSLLCEMGSVIPKGLDCVEVFENKDRKKISESKAEFMKSLEEFELKKEKKQMLENIEEDIEL
ncbi:MAG: hypothetical protein HFJ33_00930 [Clostridia bacterium]|nr:hypothetical protein [Clostridia bacterium]